MTEIQRILDSMESGAPGAAEELFPVVYDDLRRRAAMLLAQEQPGQTLDPTGLVHEAYLKLAGGKSPFAGRRHFFRVAAEAMRRILIDQARRKKALRHGGDGRKFELSESDRIELPAPETLLAIDEALEKLSADDPPSAELARLRLFAGLPVDEAGEMLGMSRATAFRNWDFARAVLTSALRSGDA
jgi:RNA polymerase sigma factor (TIGR02999 family)